MSKKDPGRNRASDIRGPRVAEVTAAGPGRIDNLYFHPQYLMRLERSVRRKRRALVRARTEAIASVLDAIDHLHGRPGGIEPELVRALIETLMNALLVLEARSGPATRDEIAVLLEAQRQVADALAAAML